MIIGWSGIILTPSMCWPREIISSIAVLAMDNSHRRELNRDAIDSQTDALFSAQRGCGCFY